MNPTSFIVMAILWIGIRVYFLQRQGQSFTLDNLLWVGPAADIFMKIGGVFFLIGLVYGLRNAVVSHPIGNAAGVVMGVEGDKSKAPFSARPGFSRNSYEWPVVAYQVASKEYTFKALPTWPGHYHTTQQVTVFYPTGNPERAWLRADLIDFPFGLMFLGALLLIIGKRSDYLDSHW